MAGVGNLGDHAAAGRKDVAVVRHDPDAAADDAGGEHDIGNLPHGNGLSVHRGRERHAPRIRLSGRHQRFTGPDPSGLFPAETGKGRGPQEAALSVGERRLKAQLVFPVQGIGDEIAPGIADGKADQVKKNAPDRAVWAGGHHKGGEKAGRPPSDGGHLRYHDEGAAEAGTETRREKRPAKWQRNAVDERFPDAQEAGGQRASDDGAEIAVPGLFRLFPEGKGRAHLPRACHGESRVKRDIAQLLQLNAVQGHQSMVHARRHQRKKEGGRNIAGHGPHKDILGLAGLAEQPHDASGGIAKERHDKDYIGNHAEKHGEQRRKDHIDRPGHDGAYGLLHIGDQKSARDDGQHTAFSAAEDRIQRYLDIVKPHNGSNFVDAVQRGDHAQHTPKDRRGSKAFRRAVACPRGQVAHHGDVDEGQKLVDKSPQTVVRIVRHRLRYEGRKA